MSPRLLALIPAAVAINMVIGQLAAELGLPVYLDTLGTMLVAVLVGMRGGLLVGTVSQLLSALLRGYVWLPFTPLQWLVAILAAAVATRRGFATTPRSIAWGLAAGVACGLVSSVISYLLFGGVTATGVTTVGAFLRSLGLPLAAAVTAASVSTDMLDKAISFAVAGLLLRSLPRRIVARFPMATRAVGR